MDKPIAQSLTVLLYGDGPRGVAIGLAAEVHRQNALSVNPKYAADTERAKVLHRELTGVDAAPRKLSAQPEYSK
jgi:hypothetical protein